MWVLPSWPLASVRVMLTCCHEPFGVRPEDVAVPIRPPWDALYSRTRSLRDRLPPADGPLSQAVAVQLVALLDTSPVSRASGESFMLMVPELAATSLKL